MQYDQLTNSNLATDQESKLLRRARLEYCDSIHIEAGDHIASPE